MDAPKPPEISRFDAEIIALSDAVSGLAGGLDDLERRLTKVVAPVPCAVGGGPTDPAYGIIGDVEAQKLRVQNLSARVSAILDGLVI